MDGDVILNRDEVSSDVLEKDDQECNRSLEKPFKAAVGLDWFQPECLLLLFLISHLMPLLALQLLPTASSPE